MVLRPCLYTTYVFLGCETHTLSYVLFTYVYSTTTYDRVTTWMTPERETSIIPYVKLAHDWLDWKPS